ncbi:MFS transporter [Methylobacterium oryzihabitans]|uniref:MFS transporter n=1 Tax=Methylobacterium oryzihabitans TaxID=2499852 RepID=A0A3S2XJZ6_9HYPH|nr:MFS transporter [Methylobacterium oryzihabitans]RVU16647.1 MFS transporter [Methylobacterium oryzihabitans]
MQHLPEPDPWNARGRLIAATLGLGGFLANFDVTSVVVILPAIGTDLGLRVDRLAWIVDAYSLAFTATLLVAGALADRFGRRRMLLIGNLGFLAASLACGFAPSGALFLAARAAQGCGAAFLVTGTFASIAAAFPARGARARAFGVVGVVSGVAMALGPSLGGIIGSGLGWRWIFLVNLPFCLAIAAAVPRLVTDAPADTRRPLDWPGVLLLTLALGLVIEAILDLRRSPVHTVIGVAAGAGLVGWFVARQRRRPHPLLDPTVFASRPMAGLAALLLAVSVGYWAVLVYLPLFLSEGFGWTPEATGMGLLAATVPMLVIPPFGGTLAVRLGLRGLFATALTLLALGAGALVLAALVQTGALALAWAFAGMALLGIGAALSHPQLSGAVLALAPPEAGGMASAVTVIARQAGFALGVAGLGALMPSAPDAVGFAWPFGVAAGISTCGLLACRLLPPSSSEAAGA